jgi:hypothetical protein
MKASKTISWLVIPVIFFMFLTFPYLETKAYADNFQPPPTDYSQPGFIDMFSFTRMMGKEEAVYFSIPANQVSPLIPLPSNPSPFILAKYEREKAKGNIFVMRIWQAGPWMRGEILRITPRNWQHFMGTHFYNFAFLIPKQSDCILPGTDTLTEHIGEVEKAFVEYDYKVKELIDQGYNPNVARNAVRDPTVSLRIMVGNPNIYNNTDYYWYQRLNDDTNCWDKVGAGDYDKGDGEFHDISEYAFYNMVALAMEVHKAGVGLIMFPKVRQQVEQSTSKSAFRKRVTTTVKYYVYPEYLMVFPHGVSQSYGEFAVNPGNSVRSKSYDFIKIQGNHNFPLDETLVYQWSQTKSGWTGFAVFLGSILIGAITGGLGGLIGLGNPLTIALGGGAVGAIGGLIASGFSPTTSTTAYFTPFVYSKYQLNPSAAWSGDAKAVADRTFDQWLRPDVQNTPGGVGVFVSRIDMRKAVLCGSPSNTDNCNPEVDQPVVQVHGTDPRFWSIFNEMFHHASQYLMKYKYPFEAPAR